MAKKKSDDGGKADGLETFFGSLRSEGGRGHSFPTTASIERAMTEGPLVERTDYRPDDIRGIVFLSFVGENLGVPEYVNEAELWSKVFISRDRKSREEYTATLIAKIAREAELASIEAKKESIQQGRERRQ
jgi:hypothetical protein